MDVSKETNMDAESSHPKETRIWIPDKCIPQAPKYTIKTTRIGEHTQFMRDHALIGKFLGFCPSVMDLAHWIKAWWNPKGDYELQLSSKGFFIVIFYNLEDKDKIFEGGSYLDRPLLPKKGKLRIRIGMYLPLFPTSRDLVRGNFTGHRQHPG
jgi:hypothetical protein